MSAFIEDMLTAITARLEERFAAAGIDLRVERFPDDPDNYRLLHPKGAVLVAYGGSRFDEPEALGAIVQERRVEFDLTLLARNLRTPDGVHGQIDAIRLALTGFRLAGGGSKLWPQEERFVDHDNGVWRYAITFACTIPAIEQPEEETLPLLKRLTFTGETNTTEVQ